MTDERVERIARVLNQADAGTTGVNTWDHINEPTREEYRHMARALAALDDTPDHFYLATCRRVSEMMGDWREARGVLKDAFPANIKSEEIVRCNRNGWDYDEYIRLRDMGVDPDDIVGIADELARLRAQVFRLRCYAGELEALVHENSPYSSGDEILSARHGVVEPGDLDPPEGT